MPDAHSTPRERPWAAADEHGPWHAATVTPLRTAGSIRRTSNIDTTRPNGFGAPVVVDARARDLSTSGTGSAAVLGVVHVGLVLDPNAYRVTSLVSDPDRPDLQSLVGTTVARGFRRSLDTLTPGDRDAANLMFLLLDDLPGASLVSGYARLHAGAAANDPSLLRLSPGDGVGRSDICAGWQSEGTMMVSVREEGQMLTPFGPIAPVLNRHDDQHAWHEVGSLSPHATRRRRRIDVWIDPADAERVVIDAFFRDSHVDEAGLESVVHEYAVRGAVRRESTEILELTTVADVLPWRECVAAVASTQTIVGRRLDGLRNHVREQLTGASTCTHLNDTLRALEDVRALVPLLTRSSGR